MPTHGRAMSIAVGPTPTAVGSLTEWSRDGSCGDVDVTACGDTAKQFLTDLPEHSGRMAGFWAAADAGQLALEAAFLAGTAIAVHVYPLATKVAGTDKEWYGDVRITNYNVGGGVSSAFTFEFSYKGALTLRTIPT